MKGVVVSTFRFLVPNYRLEESAEAFSIITAQIRLTVHFVPDFSAIGKSAVEDEWILVAADRRRGGIQLRVVGR